MLEKVDFRVDKSLARKYLGRNVGKELSDLVLQIITRSDSDLCKKIVDIERKIEREKSDDSFCTSYVSRVYTSDEIKKAELFRFHIVRLMHVSSKENGTVYDESSACSECDGGRKRVGPLILDLRRAPKTSGLAKTYDEAWIVSEGLAEAMVEADITGFELRPVRHKTFTDDEAIDFTKVPSGRKLLEQFKKTRLATWRFCFWVNKPENKKLVNDAQIEWCDYLQQREIRKRKPYPAWYELIITSNPIRILEPSLWGNTFFDLDDAGEYKCSKAPKLNHAAGLNLVSEAHISRKDWDKSDLCRSVQLYGHTRYPTPVLFMSHKLKGILEKHAKRSFYFEVAHLN